MTVGTKSLLFGVHQFFFHPIFVALAWRRIYGAWPARLPVWVAFLVHDWGYWGCPEMDGLKGKRHPLLGARIMERFFGAEWGRFCKYHSRSLARIDGADPSPLCAPDKLAILFYPRWLYLLLARASGELYEYLRNADSPAGRAVGIDASTPQRWFDTVRVYMLGVAESLARGEDAGVPPEMMKARCENCGGIGGGYPFCPKCGGDWIEVASRAPAGINEPQS